jgi:hypothetical protein
MSLSSLIRRLWQIGLLPRLPYAKFTATSASNTSLSAGDLTGAVHVVLNTTANGANALTVRSAAQMFADTPGAFVGMRWMLRIQQTGDNTLTVTQDAGATVTLTGTMTLTTGTFRDFVCSFTSAVAASIQAVGTGTA